MPKKPLQKPKTQIGLSAFFDHYEKQRAPISGDPKHIAAKSIVSLADSVDWAQEVAWDMNIPNPD